MFFDSAVTLAAMLTPGVFVSGDFTAIRGDDVGYDPTEVLEAALDGELEIEPPDDVATPEDLGDVDDDMDDGAVDDEYGEDFEHGTPGCSQSGSVSLTDKVRVTRLLRSSGLRPCTGPQWAKHRDFGPGEVRKLRRERRRRYTVVDFI